MTPEHYFQLKTYVHKKLFSFAQEFAEDCTQYVALKLIENPKRHWRHVIYDWLRENGYSNGPQVRVGAKPLAFKTQSIDFKVDIDFDQNVVEPCFDLITYDLDQLIQLTTPRCQKVLNLFRLGLNQAEISFELGITEGRVSQLMTEGIRQIQTRIRQKSI